MRIDKIMEEYGFEASSSCSGFEWYTKRIRHMGKDAFITITANDELQPPESLGEPVLVSINDLHSGDELEKPQRFESLQSYFDTLKL
jgi:hypothetical protein